MQLTEALKLYQVVMAVDGIVRAWRPGESPEEEDVIQERLQSALDMWGDSLLMRRRRCPERCGISFGSEDVGTPGNLAEEIGHVVLDHGWSMDKVATHVEQVEAKFRQRQEALARADSEEAQAIAVGPQPEIVAASVTALESENSIPSEDEEVQHG